MYDEFARWLFPLGYPERTLGYGAASDTIALATQTLTKLPEPFFLFVHLHEPHDPYETPPPFKDKYARVGNREAREKLSGFYYGRYQPDLQPFVDAERDHYDEAIEYLDAELEQFVDALQRNPKSQNTLLVFTADHVRRHSPDRSSWLYAQSAVSRRRSEDDALAPRRDRAGIGLRCNQGD